MTPTTGPALYRFHVHILFNPVYPAYCLAFQVVVMTFCEGFKVTDAKALAAADLDREGVMRAVTESFAYQVRRGVFRIDPSVF